MIRPSPSLPTYCFVLATLVSLTVVRAEPASEPQAENPKTAAAPTIIATTPAEQAPAPSTAQEPPAAQVTTEVPPPTETRPTTPPAHAPTGEQVTQSAKPETSATTPAVAETTPPAPTHKPAPLPGPDPKEIRAQIGGLQRLGITLTERGDWDAAEISFRQILAMRSANDDELAPALIGLARVYRRQGSLTKAAAIYERFLADYGTNNQVPDALLELGRTHRALGAHQLALARFYSVINSTLKVSGEGFIHYQMLAKTAQFEIAETHFQQGNFAEANKFFSRLRLLDLAPADRARAHFKSAYALYLGKNFESAITTLYAYLEQWPQDEYVPEARNLLALALRTLDRKQEALDATLALLSTQKKSADPKRWAYWQRRTGNQLANDFFQNGDTLNALAIYQGLAALAPEPPWRLPITYQTGLCYERMRDYTRATAAYQDIADTVARITPTASPELIELARMAKWRIGQLTWQASTETQLTDLFDHIPAPKAVKVADKSPSTTTAPSVHDNPGNPSKTPPSL